MQQQYNRITGALMALETSNFALVLQCVLAVATHG
jgi:hypothetical protein